jgi:uncharacterized protein
VARTASFPTNDEPGIHPLARRAWTMLMLFWSSLLVAAAIGGTVLTLLGPPPDEMPAEASGPSATFFGRELAQLAKLFRHGAPAAPRDHAEAGTSADAAPPATPPPAGAAADADAPPTNAMLPPPPLVHAAAAPSPPSASTQAIAPPDPALLEPAPDIPGGYLPRIAADGRAPMQVYAAHFDPSDHRPRVAILIAGMGMNLAESEAAATRLPASVSLAITPYATRLDALLDRARAAGHELLVSAPLEPAGYPFNDPGHRALLTGAPLAQNAQRLEWTLTRFNGFAGVTGALGDLHGERFVASPGQMGPMLEALAARGLFFVDARPNARMVGLARQPRMSYRGVDLVLDETPGPDAIDAALAKLEKLAVSRGAAIGLIGRPSPVAVDRLSVWATALDGRGVSLAPVSLVVQMPQAP